VIQNRKAVADAVLLVLADVVLCEALAAKVVGCHSGLQDPLRIGIQSSEDGLIVDLGHGVKVVEMNSKLMFQVVATVVDR
jgi:hypothetical protein